VILSIPDALPATLRVRLTAQTEICRNSCNATWTALKVGDRVQVGTYDGPAGVRVGDAVYFTGTADTPNMATPSVWAVTVFQMQMGLA
jgi:hypothetical protein